MVLPGPPMALITPAPTPATTHTYAIPRATTAFTRMNDLRLELRRDLSSDFANDLSCANIVDSMTCDSAYVSCIESVDTVYYNTKTERYDYDGLVSAVTSCYCNYGVRYLSCYYSAIEQPACAGYLGTYDWQSYESYWFEQYCGTVPPTEYAQGKGKGANQAPTSVSLDLQSVAIVTLTSTPPIPDYTYTPNYKSTGNLLSGECASTHFTLLEDVSTVYWAAYIGCASDKPQCCPWTAASAFFAVTASGTVTVTSTVTATAVTGTDMGLNAYPVAANAGQSILKSCAADYYSISGACCPSSYWPFTRGLGGQTPCYSSMETVTQAPTLTYGSMGQPSATDKPTSAVVNVVWAMSYPVASKSGLSKGAVAGISVAAVVIVGALGLLAICVFRYRHKHKQLQKALAPAQPQPQHQVSAITQGTASMLVPQSTGATVSELGSGMNSISSTSGLTAGSPHPVSTGSSASPLAYPAPIVEADETSYQQPVMYAQPVYAQPQQTRLVELANNQPSPQAPVEVAASYPAPVYGQAHQ